MIVDDIGHPSPYLSTPGCAVCHMPPTVVSLYTGRRCDTHRPKYDPQTAVDLLMAGWADTARAYAHYWMSQPGRDVAA